MCHRPQLLLLLCCQRLRERAMETEISRQKEKETAEWGEIWGYTTAIQILPPTSDPSVSPSVCLSITSTFSTISFFCLSSIALSSAPCNPECCAIPAGSTGSHRHEPSYRGGKSVPPHHQPPQKYHRVKYKCKQCFMCYFSAMAVTAWWKINNKNTHVFH